MAVFLYVIVSASVAEKLGCTNKRQKLSNGCYLLNQNDFSSEPESTLWGKVMKFNGAIVTEAEAKLILSGGKEPPAIIDEANAKVANQDSVSQEKEVNDSETENKTNEE